VSSLVQNYVPAHSEGVDIGVWALKCQNCGHPFEVELMAGERIVSYAKNTACPSCKKTPSAIPESAWHHITGFHVSKAL